MGRRKAFGVIPLALCAVPLFFASIACFGGGTGQGTPPTESAAPDIQATVNAALAKLNAATVETTDTPIVTRLPGVAGSTGDRAPTPSRATHRAPVWTATPIAAAATVAPPATPTLAPTPPPAAGLRHIQEKRYMLQLINAERKRAGLNPVVLGDNVAAQLHAESALQNCISSHWGVDGLKPYMRYSLACGYQSNGENGLGLDYCVRGSEGYRALGSIAGEIDDGIDAWMGSSGHRRNILDPQHKRVNIGIAWDRHNLFAYQHFEGDYVEYPRLPSISDGVLSLAGETRNGVTFGAPRDLAVSIYYDPPPHPLTRGQLARTYCYSVGRQVAALRPPLVGGSRYTSHEFSITLSRCPDPYDVSEDTPGPRSAAEAHRAWEEAYQASQSMHGQPVTVPWITASEWVARGTEFAIRAEISDVLRLYGSGVYTVMAWGDIAGERGVISEYSIFHGVEPPGTYHPDGQ